MKEKVGVFLCRCGDIIASVVDFAALKAALETLPGVAFVATHDFLCAADGKDFFSAEMIRTGATHAVVAACSPKDHEQDFRECLEKAGINPYLLQLANVREHCAWVTRDPTRAFAKCLALIKAAIRRVKLHEALQQREIDCNPDVLVIGGGIAGMEAALLAAQGGRHVSLVDSSPSIGGRVPQYEEVAPNLECGSCMISPRLSAVHESRAIRLFTNSEVTELLGFLGNFSAKIARHARLVDPDLCIGCDECMQVCPVEVPNAFDHGLGRRKAIYIPFPGSVPNCAVIDREHCLRFKGEDCTACARACPAEAVAFGQSDETIEVKAGAIILATGFDTFPAREIERLGHGRLEEVYTLSEFERLCSTTGPTGGKLLKRNGEPPRSVAVLHCVGREELGYCSGLCCQSALKIATYVHHQELACRVVHLHSDRVLPGWLPASLQHRAVKEGATFIHSGDLQQTRVTSTANGLQISYLDAKGTPRLLEADMVVLVTGLVPNRATVRLADMLDLVRNDAGFLAAEHPILRPSQSSQDGIYLAGCASGPKSIAESITQAQSAAGLALATVQPGKKLAVAVITAHAEEALCSGCMVCVSVCPYTACKRDEATGLVEVNPILCRGCGTCVAACPSGAAKARHFSDEQLYAEIQEVLHD